MIEAKRGHRRNGFLSQESRTSERLNDIAGIAGALDQLRHDVIPAVIAQPVSMRVSGKCGYLCGDEPCSNGTGNNPDVFCRFHNNFITLVQHNTHNVPPNKNCILSLPNGRNGGILCKGTRGTKSWMTLLDGLKNTDIQVCILLIVYVRFIYTYKHTI